MRLRRYIRIHEGRSLPGLFLEHLEMLSANVNSPSTFKSRDG